MPACSSTLREQSNVGHRVFDSIFETLISVDKQGDLSLSPGLAERWKRIDNKTIEFKLRRGVIFHNGEEMTAEDVAFSFGPERMWGFAKDGEAPQTGQRLFAQSAVQSALPRGGTRRGAPTSAVLRPDRGY